MAERAHETLEEALRHPRYEVIPLDRTVDRVVEHLPTSVVVTVTASPARGLDATLDTAERLRGHGYRVVPHLSARLVSSERELKEIVERLAGAGVEDVFVIGGDVPDPLGPYPDGLSLLEAMGEIGHPFAQVGIPGYPEPHPIIHDDVLVQAMWDKRRHATYIVSQVCFSADPIVSWVRRIRHRGVHLPVHFGIPGIARKRKLLRIARRIGIGESKNFLRRHKSWIWRLGLPGAYSPSRLLLGLRPALADPELAVAGLHVYTFNELQATEAWRQECLARFGDS